jgi:hypothetical protein
MAVLAVLKVETKSDLLVKTLDNRRNCRHIHMLDHINTGKMSNRAIENEVSAWSATVPEQRSFVVRLLHWFHFRPSQLARSWKKEEVLIWELLQCLHLLPRSCFLAPLLSQIQLCAPEAADLIVQFKADLGAVEIDEYPSLGLNGHLRNRRADIGFRLRPGPVLWIEAKTSEVSSQDLYQQLSDEYDALRSLAGISMARLVALIPASQARPSWPSISWSDIVAVLGECRARLLSLSPDPDISRGYVLLADELQDRIVSHEYELVA